MQIVADTGMDAHPAQLEGLDVHIVPHIIQLDGVTYRSGIDVTADEFYQILAATDGLPTTSTPSPRDYIDLFRELAKTDPDILVIAMSSGLSITHQVAVEAAQAFTDANIHVYDTLTLSGAAGWLVEHAARAAKAGWSLDQILPMLDRIREHSMTLYTLSDLTHLIHGGRISHMKGLIASVLNLKPIIGVDTITGKYVERGRTRSFKRALKTLVDLVIKEHVSPEEELHLQVMHTMSIEDGYALAALFHEQFNCFQLPFWGVAPVLGAHSGPTMVGAAVAPHAVFADLPWEVPAYYLDLA